MSGRRWNSNLHAFEQLMKAIPDGAQRGLDVGCGEGETARRLRERVAAVIGIDPDRPSIEQARMYNDDIQYIVTDLDSAELPDQSFDVVSAVAMLHHLDQRAGLTKLAALVRPGGLLIVVGLAKSRSLSDFAQDASDAVTVRRHTFRNNVWVTPAPKLDPALNYAHTRSAWLDVLPRAQIRRIPFFRYGLTWTRPKV
jgi:2-polyprenyl-3-methyl-5-hydroxy-6-metoxy-1,4-benzoquinol methylase